MGKLQVIVGGQAGSEAKGAVTAHLAHPDRTPDGLVAIRVAGPNAGHTAVDADGRRWALRTIPVAAVVNPYARLCIAAGSEVDISVLLKEVRELEGAGFKIAERLTIDPMATILSPEHIAAEQASDLTARLGSTSKGIGAARAARIMREAQVVRDTDLHDLCEIAPVSELARGALQGGYTTAIEGTQGHALGLHHPYYPQVTSSDCRAIDFLAMAGLSPWDVLVDQFEVWVVYRPFPIRVAGNSGPLRDESSWEALGLPEERTTVTKKVRRVGGWDPELAREAVIANGGPGPHLRLALSMADQIDPTVAGVTNLGELSPQVMAFVDGMEDLLGSRVRLIGTSDRTMVAL